MVALNPVSVGFRPATFSAVMGPPGPTEVSCSRARGIEVENRVRTHVNWVPKGGVEPT